jgi:SAM-dependent methyltransferase
VSLSPAYFEALYAASTDPWGLASRPYEARKYAITLATLPRSRYKRAFEPGCSIGVLTRMLAARSDHVLATDASLAAVTLARRSGLPQNVRLEHASVPEQWPDGRFDLIVFSELGYYYDQADLDSFVRHAASALEPDGHLVAVHWRQPVRDYPGTAANVHSKLLSSSLVRLGHYQDEHFLLDLFGAGPSAALTPPDPERSSRPS